MADQQRADDLQDRLIDFAVRLIRLADALPKTPAGRRIAGQVLRSGTSPAPNHGEARGAESRADFNHKLAVVLKELNETAIWLRIIQRSGLLSESKIASLTDESEQLCRILTASVKTTRTNQQLPRNKRQPPPADPKRPPTADGKMTIGNWKMENGK